MESSSSVSSILSNTPKLDSSDKWDEWHRATERYFRAIGVWQYVDQQNLLGDQKKEPQPSKESDWPDPIEYEGTTSEERAVLSAREARATRKEALFKGFAVNKRIAMMYLLGTTDEIGKRAMDGKDTLREQVQALRLKYAPSDFRRRQTLQSEMDRLSAGHTSKSYEQWISSWMTLEKRMEDLNPPHPQLLNLKEEFVHAVEKNPATEDISTNLWGILLNKQGMPDNSVTLDDLLQYYLNRMRSKPIQKNTKTKQVHSAFQGQEEDEDQEDQDKASESRPSSTSSAKKRSKGCKTLTKKSDSENCETFNSCKTINPDLRPSHLSSKEQIWFNTFINSITKEDPYSKHWLKIIREKFPNDSKREEAVKKKQSKSKAKTEEKAKDKEEPKTVQALKIAEADSDNDLVLAATAQTSSKSTDSWIMDTGAEVHIINDWTKANFKALKPGKNSIAAGSSLFKTVALGTCTLDFGNKKKLVLNNVHYVPGFHVNIVSHNLLQKAGIWWHGQTNQLFYKNKVWLKLNQPEGTLPFFPIITRGSGQPQIYDWPMQDDKPVSPEEALQAAALQAHPTFTRSRDPRPPRHLTEAQWHLVLGHLGKDRITHITDHADGARILKGGKGPTVEECQTCALAKSKRRPYRLQRTEYITAPFGKVSMDVCSFTPARNGDEYMLHIIDVNCKLHFVWTFPTVNARAVSEALEELIRFLNSIGRRLFAVGGDNDPRYGKEGNKVHSVLRDNHIAWQPSAVYTPEQDQAERAGALIITMARAMRIHSGLPSDMWPEIVRAAAYILNRIPTHSLNWKTPWEAATGHKPNVAHLRAYGCKAYAHILKERGSNSKPTKNEKLAARAHIGYLVGYQSSNQYRIWRPSIGDIIITRDVIFDEGSFYNPGELELAQVNPSLDLRDFTIFEEALHSASEFEDLTAAHFIPLHQGQGVNEEADHQPVEPITAQHQRLLLDHPYWLQHAPLPSIHHLINAPILAEEDTPHHILPPLQQEQPQESDFTDVAQTQPEEHQVELEIEADQSEPDITSQDAEPNMRTIFPIQESFVPIGVSWDGSTKPSKRQRINATLVMSGILGAAKLVQGTQESFLHRSKLDPEPRHWDQLLKRKDRKKWMEACNKEFTKTLTTATFVWIKISECKSGTVPLPLMWVFKYKLNEMGMLLKYKARLCARGDLQATHFETYAATLAAKVFRLLCAIIAIFDLEAEQFDVVNAFLNSTLPYEVYAQPPPGFERPGYYLLLKKALYGLKEAPLLWYAELTATLESMGFQPIPGCPCLYMNTDTHLYIFFYVDDLVLFYNRKNKAAADKFKTELQEAYELNTLGDLNWFLGLKVTRDRSIKTLWLSQEEYVEKLCNRHAIQPSEKATTPLPSTLDLSVPENYKAETAKITAFQSMVGGLNYAATQTRPDIAKAVSILSQHLTNPTDNHLKGANHVLKYLSLTKDMAICYKPDLNGPLHFSHEDIPEFLGASDATFGTEKGRKSAQGLVFMFKGGPIEWKAASQKTVTKSSTEAELLALSYAGSSMIWWQRFFESIALTLKEKPTMFCDNKQTLRLVQTDKYKLDTKLRHVDIHNHWLRQENNTGNLNFQWIPTADMVADGMTKMLPPQKHLYFVQLQIGRAHV